MQCGVHDVFHKYVQDLLIPWLCILVNLQKDTSRFSIEL
jgi:hypothetical protein